MMRRTALGAVLASAALATAACGGSAATEEAAAPASPDAGMTSEAPMASEEPMDGESADPAAMLVGPACEDYAAQVPDGAGSVAGMAEDPVATAASNNPLLTTLTAAVSGELNPDVNLVDTLNGGEFTVFAPVDEAFAAVDEATVETLSTDADLLTTVLTYHVVEGQLSPEEIVGEQTTLQGGTVTVAESGETLTVNDATVVCGGVQTANATVYLIDEVMMPPAA
jgi:uncharacterized surface protein with fasciclin (FAS1) repeats